MIVRSYILHYAFYLQDNNKGTFPNMKGNCFQNRREQLKLQVKDNHLTGASRIYENQIKEAGQKKFVDCFDDKKVRFVMGIAQPQSGKTTTAVSFIDQFIERHELPIENIFRDNRS